MTRRPLALALLVAGLAGAPAWRAVTLEDLLRHRAGLPEDRERSSARWMDAPRAGTLPEERRDVARFLLARPPRSPPGSETR